MIVNATTAIEDLTLLVEQEIHVHASLEDTFAALLEQLGHGERSERRPRDADGAGSMAGRAVVSRSRRRQRSLLGARASHQTADAAGILRAADDVAPGGQQRAIQTERRAGWNADQVPSFRIWVGSGRSSQRRGRRLGLHPRTKSASARKVRSRSSPEPTISRRQFNFPQDTRRSHVDYTNAYW